ncbi:MAG: DUF309 domain-containing protein [Chloroflexia bacterium]
MKPETVDKVRKRLQARKIGGPAATGEEDPWSCEETPPDLLYVGIEEFNKGLYFEQHETLEEIWQLDPRPLRRLYQGILKIGVGFYKLRLGNYRGTINHINGGIAYLQLFDPGCLGIDTARLISEAAAVRDQVMELGPERISEFDLSTLPRVHYTERK